MYQQIALTAPQGARASALSRLHDHTDTPQSAGLLWTSDQPHANTSTSQHTTFTPPAGFGPSIPASERPQTHAFDRAATGIGTTAVLKREVHFNYAL